MASRRRNSWNSWQGSKNHSSGDQVTLFLSQINLHGEWVVFFRRGKLFFFVGRQLQNVVFYCLKWNFQDYFGSYPAAENLPDVISPFFFVTVPKIVAKSQGDDFSHRGPCRDAKLLKFGLVLISPVDNSLGEIFLAPALKYISVVTCGGGGELPDYFR